MSFFSNIELRELSYRASFLHERLSLKNRSVSIKNWEEDWQEATGGNLEERLRLDGFTKDDLASALNSSPPSDYFADGWTLEVNSILGDTGSIKDIFGSIADRASKDLSKRVFENLLPSAIDDLKKALLNRLLFLSRHAVSLEMDMSLSKKINLKTFFKTYPVLLRLIVTIVGFWKKNIEEFVLRLENDRPLLGKIEKVKASLSDPHNGGKTVFIITFKGGKKLVYKPRKLEIEKAFFSFLRLFNEKGHFSFKIPKLICCSNWGWMEYIPKSSSKRPKPKEFYLEIGELLCIIYILRGRDFHRENVIFSKKHPVFIDLECLITPALKKPFSGLENPLLQTLLLPINVSEVDISGISGKPKEATRSLEYCDTIEEGFKKVYKFILENKREIEGFILTSFKDLKGRIVMRDTNLYYSFLSKCSEFNFLENGLERNLELECLSKPLLFDLKFFWPILRREFDSLNQMDVPKMVYSTSSPDLIDPYIENFFKKSGLDLIKELFASLGEADLKKELFYIRTSITARSLKAGDFSFSILKKGGTKTVTKDRAIEKAVSIAEDIEKCRTGNSIFQVNAGDMKVPFTAGLVKGDLYSGTLGISLFLAALSRVLENNRFRNLSLTLLEEVRKSIDSGEIKMVSESIGIGGFSGIGSYVYSLNRIGLLLGEKALIKEALKVSSLITHKNGSEFDVIGGSSGAILALLSLNNEEEVKRAIPLGQHLIQNGCMEKGLLGFAHGVSGIAYSLFKLYQKTGEEQFLKASLKGFSYERSHFSKKHNNWPDFRAFPSRYLSQWCNGATGIGFARLAVLALNDEDLKNDLKIALSIAQKADEKRDHLCCGNFGIVDFLLTASLRVDKKLEKEAKERANLLLNKKHFFLVGSQKIDLPFFGFMQGSSGVGYELLRLFYPEELPSVLLLE